MLRARLVARLVMEVRVPEGTRAKGLASWSAKGGPEGGVVPEGSGGGAMAAGCPPRADRAALRK